MVFAFPTRSLARAALAPPAIDALLRSLHGVDDDGDLQMAVDGLEASEHDAVRLDLRPRFPAGATPIRADLSELRF